MIWKAHGELTGGFVLPWELGVDRRPVWKQAVGCGGRVGCEEGGRRVPRSIHFRSALGGALPKA
jgi:hypothetical protein